MQIPARFLPVFSRISGMISRLTSRLPKKPASKRFVSGALIVSSFVFAVCAGILLFRLVILPRQADASLDSARSLYRGGPSSSSSSKPGSSSPAKRSTLSFAQLRAINPDVEGWITIPGTVVDYPVLRAPASSPDYYLTHDWKRGTTKYGSIYQYPLPAKSQGERKNTILYGHSMKNGQMFADLLQYDGLAYYRAHPVILYQENGSKAYWKIFAVIKANTDPAQGAPFDYQKACFSSADSFLKYLYDVRVRSVVRTPVDLKTSDEILSLSTCSYEFDGFRTVVFARRVRTGEDAEVDTAAAETNGSALYPDCWYRTFGGTKPSLPDFRQAVKSGGFLRLAG